MALKLHLNKKKIDFVYIVGLSVLRGQTEMKGN